MMVNMSKGAIYGFLKPYALTPGYKKVFIAFDGAMPTKEELDSLYGDNNELNLKDLVTFGNTKGPTRGYFIYGTDFIAESVTPTLYRWPASERQEDMNITALGDVNWFVFAIVDASINNLSSEGHVYDAFVGTVADVGDDGDAFIPEKRLGANQNYLLNDLELNYWN